MINNNKISSSIRTKYGIRNLKGMNRIKSPQNNNRCYNKMKEPWSALISKTSKEGQNKISNNPNFQSNILNSNLYNNNEEKNHFKKSNNYEMGTTTQITTLPGGIKRNKYEIKDDMYFRKPFNESRMYKMIHDFNSDLNYEDNYNPITQGYNVNEFPNYQRYFGSYRKKTKTYLKYNENV